MPQKNAQDRLWKILTPVLLVLAVLAMAKTLFVGLEIDEEYAFSLGFRLVKGDRLFYTMWEPHQLSALPAALVLALYTAIAGTTTGALLFVRAMVLVCKAAMSAVFYRDFKQTIGRHGALLSAVVLFVYTPKWFLGPDYISQQFHFTVAAFLCFYHYYTHGFRRPWLVVLGAVCACFSFLAFPQSALAAAVIFIGMVLLGRRGKEPTICKIPRGAVLFVLGCMACAAAFLAYVLPGMGLTVFLQRVSLILNDPQYDSTTSQRLALLGSQALNTAKFLAKPLAASVVLCLLWWAKTRQKRDWIGLALNLWAILAALLCAVRAVADSSSDERYFMPALVLAAVLYAAVFGLTDTLVSWFNSENSVQMAQYAHTGMRMYFVGYFFAGFNIMAAGYLSAVNRPAEASITSICRGMVAIVACSLLLSAVFGMPGVWAAFPASELLTALLTLFLLRRKKAETA